MPDLDDATLREGLDLAFDFLCEQRLSDLIDADRLVATLDQSATVDRLAYWHTRLVVPMRARLLERGEKSTVLLGAWLPADAATQIAEMLGEPARVPRKMAERVVGSEKVRDTIRATMQDALSNFVSKVGGGGGGSSGGGGLMGAIGIGARVAGGVGRGLLGGIGEELQKQMQGRVREFVDSSVASVQSKIVDKIASDETARDLGRRRRKMFEGLLTRSEADAARTLAKGPHEKIDALLPRIVAHNAARPELRDALRDEIRAVVDELSKDTLGELLDRGGLRDAARAALHAHGVPLARALTRSAPFDAWWLAAHVPPGR